MAPIKTTGTTDDFLPASSSSSKSRKASLKASIKSSSSNPNSNNKKSSRSVPTFLSTQPAVNSTTGGSLVSRDDDDMMGGLDIERLPLYPGGAVQKTLTSKYTTTSAEAASAMETNSDSDDEDDDTVMIDPSSLVLPSPVTRVPIAQLIAEAGGADLLAFPAISHSNASGLTQRRKIGIPPHRMTPLKRDWILIYAPLVEELGLQVRMNLKRRWVEMKTSKHTATASSLSRASDFLNAYALGFSAEDAIALLRLEELYVESFEIKDVKTLHGDHLSRAIGRIAGHEGKTRFVIENASRTRIVLADTKIHVLGTFSNIKIARDSICALILGSPPGKIYSNLKQVAARSRERF